MTKKEWMRLRRKYKKSDYSYYIHQLFEKVKARLLSKWARDVVQLYPCPDQTHTQKSKRSHVITEEIKEDDETE